MSLTETAKPFQPLDTTDFEGYSDILTGLLMEKDDKIKELEEMVTITKKQHESLLQDQDFLQCLENCGVDNWNGYDYAVEMSQED